MRRDIQLLVPLVLFGLSLLAVLMGLTLLTSLKWDAVLEDAGLVEPTEISFSIPLPTSSPTQVAARDPVVAKVVEPSPTETPIVRKTHAPNTRTGVDNIDRIIDVILGVDDNPILDVLNFTVAGCTQADGLGGPPKCREGEKEGTQVEVLPILGSEGHYFRKDEINDWRGVGAVGLYAVYAVSEDTFSDENYPAGQYAVMFMESNHQFLVLQIIGDGVVRIDYVFGPDPDSKIEKEAREIILAPVPQGTIPTTGLGLTVPGWRIEPTPTPDTSDRETDNSSEEEGESKDEESAPLDQATTPAPFPEFTNLVFTRNPYQREPRYVFPSKTPLIYAVWDYTNMREGMTIRREWYRDGKLWLEREETWDFEKYGASGTVMDVSIYDFDDGIDPGFYYLRLYVDELDLGGSQNFYVLERGYSLDPQPSPDGSRIATVEAPGTIVIQSSGGKKRHLLTVDEIASLKWFPDGKNIIFVSVDHSSQFSPNRMLLGFETWIVNVDSGTRRMIGSSTESIRDAIPSPNGRYVAGISGTGWGDACLYEAFLVVLQLDQNLKRTETYHLEDFSGVLENPHRDAWFIHPDKVSWINDHQFTVELRHHCMEWFDSGIYIFDMETMHARKIGEVENGSVYSY